MSFATFEFLIFFAIVIPAYFLTPHRYRWVLLLGASYFFYAYWNINYIWLIVFSTMVDYGVARALDVTPAEQIARRRALLSLSIVVNLGVLFVFKYFNFFNESVEDLAHLLGLDYAAIALSVLLPVGISFYTFQSMAYTIDVYRGQVEPERHAGIFATFIAFFPQLVAGPIERAANMLPQFHQRFDFDYGRVVEGLRLMLWGFVKKVVIADRLAIYVNAVYADPEAHTGAMLTMAVIFFSFQVYCDFSGYSDIAIGAARVMGFKLMTNFKQPYLATSMRDLWRRWHISLTTWFRDYIYIPLGGNRVALWRMLLNTMIVFVISGLWHGAAWTFVIFGALHGFYLASETLFERQMQRLPEKRRPHLPGWLRNILVWIVWSLTLIFFRSATLDEALWILRHMWDWREGLGGLTDPFAAGLLVQRAEFAFSLFLIGLLTLGDRVDARIGIVQAMGRAPLALRWGFYYFALIGIGIALLYGINQPQFIYFQF